MAIETNEPRALTAALAAPVFATRGAGVAMGVADRHADRWAPEGVVAARSRPMRSLSFVDRLIAPWMEVAQRSAPSRSLAPHARGGVAAEDASGRPSGASGRWQDRTVSWVFPRPSFVDELQWIAAAQRARSIASMPAAMPAMFAPRATDAPASIMRGADRVVRPHAVFDYLAPAPSISLPGTDAYSSLVPLAAAQAAALMSRAVAPLIAAPADGASAPARMSPALRNVLTTMLERAAAPAPNPTARLSIQAPELEMPPVPRAADPSANRARDEATQLADRYAGQRAQLTDVQRIARMAAERELATRISSSESSDARGPVRHDAGDAPIAPRVADVMSRTTLHEQARAEAAAHARTAEPVATATADAQILDRRAPVEVAAAVAALPPELALLLGSVPGRAMQGITEIHDALRVVELIARSAAAGTSFEATRGPRLGLPSGLGGLVASVDGARSIAERPASLTGLRPLAPAPERGSTSFESRRVEQRVPTMSYLVAPPSALAAAASAEPSSLEHVAWADRWLARFAGATPRSLEVLAAPSRSPALNLPALAAAAPGGVYVAPRLADQPIGAQRMAAPASAVARYDDSAETPDDVFAQIAASARRSRVQPVASTTAPPSPIVPALAERFTMADAVANAAPVAEGAGLAAELASSPFAAALRHVMPLPAAASFDVRALLGPWATYLAPLPSAHELHVGSASGSAPGMAAAGAHGWSVAQERSSSDLALDFVTPELVLAARVYGLGPAEAVQAARLAIAGSGQLSAMASAVDRTFVQAMEIEADRRAAVHRSEVREVREVRGAAGSALSTSHAVSSTGAAFGVDRGTPRGAVLWPSATVSALGLYAAAPDGEQSMSVAVLELLAAQAVAALGTFAASSDPATQRQRVAEDPSFVASAARTATPVSAASEPGETDVLEAAAAFVPAARRARFDSLYVALSQTPSGRTWSPAARAARALALAGRGDDAPRSARDRAAAAWDVLPVVYATEGMSNRQAAHHVATTATTDTRAGLGRLSARAGEALSSYVTPMMAESSGSASSASSARSSEAQRSTPAMRASSSAQEMVRTGRPQGRYGGGEVEIPAWFEAAARKMLDDRSGGGVEGISMAELTLVNAAPASHIAASTRSAPSASPPSPSPSPGGQSNQAPQIDIETVANEVYRQILVLMDAARARNGEPYL